MDQKKEGTILMVEDDKFFVKMFKDKFTKEGFDVMIALNGKEAFSKLKEKIPDIILLDLIMPVKDGFEFLKEVKEKEEYKDIPVVVLSVLGQTADIEKATQLGVNDYIVKGEFRVSEVIEKIKQQLKKIK
ncbi:MAG: response regulator [Candidatus Nealsonbacteria bacterium]|nr:response regulator [Candidatus Nealsonbacteria bacterium]